ncbi:MAG: hypothetical protein ACHREM_06655 [Polyangiales bacterium]
MTRPAKASRCDVEKAIAPLVCLLDALVEARSTTPIDWVTAASMGLSNTQAARVARRYGFRASKLGKATLLHRSDVDAFLSKQVAETSGTSDDEPANDIAARWGLLATGGRK